MALAIGTGILKFTASFSFPWLLGSALDHVIAPHAGADNSDSARLHWLWLLLGLGVLFSIIHSLATYGRGFYTKRLGNRVIADLRQDLFDHLHRLSLHFYAKERTGSIISRLITDIQQASQLINGGIVSVAMDSTQLLIGAYLLFGISWKLALAGLSVMPLYAITFKFLNPRVKQASLRVQSQLSKISGNVQERLAGIALVKSYAAETRERERFYADTEEHFDRTIHQINLAQLVSAISEGLVHIGTTAVIALGGYLAITSDPPLTAGQVTKAIGYLAVMYLPVRRFAEVNVVYQTSLAAIHRVYEVFDITPKIVETPQAVTQPPPAGEVRFEQVCFDYHDDSDESRISLEEQPDATETDWEAPVARGAVAVPPRRLILSDLTVTIPPGQRIALVGPSGSGKTTLVSLLPRLYDVSTGKILIDGVDVRDYKLRALRSAIGIVQQDSFMFTGSIRDNIAYGRPDAGDEEVIAAAVAANCHGFISALPEGYDACLGERGVNLSGGQRQRLSIARAILKDPRILILDEATSALDTQSASMVADALHRLMAGRTCFIIAHRLSTVRDADRILVIDHGRIAEDGTHEQVLAAEGLYAQLVRQQFVPHSPRSAPPARMPAGLQAV
jgi:subfamily B ATP-binding cassette protein MsbA